MSQSSPSSQESTLKTDLLLPATLPQNDGYYYYGQGEIRGSGVYIISHHNFIMKLNYFILKVKVELSDIIFFPGQTFVQHVVRKVLWQGTKVMIELGGCYKGPKNANNPVLVLYIFIYPAHYKYIFSFIYLI